MAGSDLVARLGVDSSAWNAGLQKARSSAGSFASGIGSVFSPIGVAVAAAGAAVGAAFGAGASVSAYKESLEAQRKLSAVIEATGGAAGLTTDQITAFAGEMQTLTNFEDDATTGAAAALAAFTNIRGATFTDTIKSAMDLSTVMGGDLQSNVKLLGKALNDPAEGLAKLSRAGVTFTDAQKEQIKTLQESGDLLGAQDVILGALQDKFGGAAEAVADPWTQLQNTLGDVAENLGSVLLPSINVVAEGVSSMLSVVVDAGDSFANMGIEAAVVLENMGGIINLTLLNWELFFVQIGADAAYLFTEQIPAYLTWFGNNWYQIFETTASNTLTIFENLATNIQNIWTGVMDYFAGNPMTFDWKPLSDGFINTIGELPDIPPRAIGELERGLSESIAAATDALGQSMNESRDRITAQFDTNSKVPAGLIAPEADAGGAAKEKAAGKSESRAALAGSAEAASIFLRGIGGANDVPTKQLKVAEKQLEATEKMADAFQNWEQPEVADF